MMNTSAAVQVFTKGNKRHVMSLLKAGAAEKTTETKRETFQVKRPRISDEEAARRANKLTPEAQHHFGKENARRNKLTIVGKSNQDRSSYAPSHAERENLSRNTQKEISRVPGLYGCNRWKSNKETQENGFSFNIF